MRVLRRGLLVALAAVLVLAVIVVIRAARLQSRQLTVEPVERIELDEAAEIARLAGAIRFQTVSYENPEQFPADEFRKLNLYLEEQFPRLHRRLTREAIHQYSALYSWLGSDPNLKPMVLLAHLDTVPIVPGTEARWQYPPFDGRVADGFLWGRGTMDDKFSVVAILSAVERLLEADFQPRRTILLAFGHDEELGGPNGAEQIAKLLHARKVQAELVLDEGGAIVQGVVPGFDRQIATIGIAEKGSISLDLTVRAEGGHSSTPPEHTAIGILSAAIEKLENHQMPRGIRGAARSFMDFVGPELPLLYRLGAANLWLIEPLLGLVPSPAINATLRTTTAVTVVHGGVKANVLPTDAHAIVNFRTLPGDTSEVVTEHVRQAVDDPRVEISVNEAARDATAVSPTDADAFAFLQRTIQQVYPDVIVAPFLTLGGTDSRHFSAITPNIYRFTPLVAKQEDLARIHGLNERIAVDNYVSVIQFYAHLMRQQ